VSTIPNPCAGSQVQRRVLLGEVPVDFERIATTGMDTAQQDFRGALRRTQHIGYFLAEKNCVQSVMTQAVRWQIEEAPRRQESHLHPASQRPYLLRPGTQVGRRTAPLVWPGCDADQGGVNDHVLDAGEPLELKLQQGEIAIVALHPAAARVEKDLAGQV